ncbi:hypothetical protein BY458DRAFT_545289 [Sporodiniella umbellata]|nr:hypothetical protein BY458DRAFT_545289 [Sporodiniella umbellata]
MPCTNRCKTYGLSLGKILSSLSPGASFCQSTSCIHVVQPVQLKAMLYKSSLECISTKHIIYVFCVMKTAIRGIRHQYWTCHVPIGQPEQITVHEILSSLSPGASFCQSTSCIHVVQPVQLKAMLYKSSLECISTKHIIYVFCVMKTAIRGIRHQYWTCHVPIGARLTGYL